MDTKCENCNLFQHLEKNRIKWYKKISLENILLQKQIIKQNDIISTLHHQLLEKRTIYLSEVLNQKVLGKEDQSTLEHIPIKTENNAFQSRKLQEVNSILHAFNQEIESFRDFTQRNEEELLEQIAYLKASATYFRNALFEELEKANLLKIHFQSQITDITIDSENRLLIQLKEEYNKINKEFKMRYKETITSSKSEITKQSGLIKKLRRHICKLYSTIILTKKEFEDKLDSKQRELDNSKKVISSLRRRNICLYDQIKLTKSSG